MIQAMSTSKGKRVALAAGVTAVVVIAVALVLGWKHLVFWYRFEEIGKNAQGFPEYKHRQTGIVMVLLPGGRFLMGAQKTDPNGPNYDPELEGVVGPVHEVTLSSFMIAKFEVTQAQWKSVMGSSPSQFRGNDNRPVEEITWDDVQQFEAKTGLMLPTEAQWEYACRAGTSTPFAGTGKLHDMGWYYENSGRTTHPVGMKAPNGFGLHDMHGNVQEWCEDVYDEGFYKKPEATETDPISDTGSGERIFRGGSWRGHAWGCHSSLRGWSRPKYQVDDLGCRPSAPAP
jgi:formylglycine-generating enzyme required for sulfatase activity